MTTKILLRRHIRRLKASHTIAQLRAGSRSICQQVLHTPQWQAAQKVLLYHPLPDEVDILPLFRQAQAAGKQVILPVVQQDHLLLKVFTGNTTTGAYSIQEPTGPLFTAWEQIDLALVPGMAFDTQGHRLGRGKGYYDRTLPHLPHAYKIGICFPFQRVEAVPTDTHDIPMNQVIS